MTFIIIYNIAKYTNDISKLSQHIIKGKSCKILKNIPLNFVVYFSMNVTKCYFISFFPKYPIVA